MTLQRCDEEQKHRNCLFKQLLENDSKSKSGSLTKKMSDNLRGLLLGDDKKDMSHILCSLGNTSHNEANHARIVTRGYHVKGKTSSLRHYYVIITLLLRHHYVIITSSLKIKGPL